MAGYLDEYGVQDAKRERLHKRLAVSFLIAAVTAGGLYFIFRNYKEEQQFKRFVELLAKNDYQSAYRLWGCTEEKPCKGYPYESFIEDWGPKSSHAEIASARVVKTRSCSSGVIKTLEFPRQEEVLLWIERKDLTLGFAPWPVCNPKMPSPQP